MTNKLLHDHLYPKDNFLHRETSGDLTGIVPRLRLILLAKSEKNYVEAYVTRKCFCIKQKMPFSHTRTPWRELPPVHPNQ